MTTIHKDIIERAHTWYDDNGHRFYYEIGETLIKNENGFLYIYNHADDDWELQEPTVSKRPN